jgi:hypothetical protein
MFLERQIAPLPPVVFELRDTETAGEPARPLEGWV